VNFKTLFIGLVIAFGGIISYLLFWPDGSPATVATRSDARPTPSASERSANRERPMPPPETPAPDAVPAVPVAAANASAANPEADGDDYSGSLPLAYDVYNRRRLHKIEGYVMNTSRRTLSVTLEAVGAEGQSSQTAMSLAPGERRNFGTDTGLELHENDRIILHSPPYPDGVIEVP
jgi:hypothetical protein